MREESMQCGNSSFVSRIIYKKTLNQWLDSYGFCFVYCFLNFSLFVFAYPLWEVFCTLTAFFIQLLISSVFLRFQKMAKFMTPVIQDNPSGWGPCAVPEQFRDMPYQPFSKGDRLGKVLPVSRSLSLFSCGCCSPQGPVSILFSQNCGPCVPQGITSRRSLRKARCLQRHHEPV